MSRSFVRSVLGKQLRSKAEVKALGENVISAAQLPSKTPSLQTSLHCSPENQQTVQQTNEGKIARYRKSKKARSEKKKKTTTKKTYKLKHKAKSLTEGGKNGKKLGRPPEMLNPRVASKAHGPPMQSKSHGNSSSEGEAIGSMRHPLPRMCFHRFTG